MKKKLIIAAAIAFAVFAIPYGSSALSTVSVASENNTVVTPSTKPVEEVKNAVDAIDTSKITDAASADNAAAALTKIGSQDLKEAMNAGQDTVNDVAAIEAAYKKAKGIKDTTLANSGAVKAVGIVGAAFVAPDTTLSVEAPAATPEIASSTYAVTSTPVYVEISLKAGPSSVKSLPIPVAVTIETPAGVDGNKAVIFHFVNGGLEEIKPIYNASANTLTFTVNHFSTFAIAEAKAVAAAEGSDNAFQRYRDNLASEIANAKDGAIIKITRDKEINALPNDIMYKDIVISLLGAWILREVFGTTEVGEQIAIIMGLATVLFIFLLFLENQAEKWQEKRRRARIMELRIARLRGGRMRERRESAGDHEEAGADTNAAVDDAG